MGYNKVNGSDFDPHDWGPKKRWGPDTGGPCEDRKKTPLANQEDRTQEEPVLGHPHLGLPAPRMGGSGCVPCRLRLCCRGNKLMHSERLKHIGWGFSVAFAKD